MWLERFRGSGPSTSTREVPSSRGAGADAAPKTRRPRLTNEQERKDAMTNVTSPAGEVRREADGRRTLLFRRQFPDPIDDVWSAVTDSERLSRWFGSYAGVGTVGGSVQLRLTAEEDAGGEPSTVHIIECQPPRRLVVDLPETATRSWRIALTLVRRGDTTTLLFEQSVPPEMDITEVGPGWHWYLDRLIAAVADAPMPDWNDYYPALASTYR